TRELLQDTKTFVVTGSRHISPHSQRSLLDQFPFIPELHRIHAGAGESTIPNSERNRNNLQWIRAKRDWSRARLENRQAALFVHAYNLPLSLPVSLGEGKKHAHLRVEKWIGRIINRADVADQPDNRDPAVVRRIQLPVIAK